MTNQKNPGKEKVLAYVLGYWADNGFAPTMKEVSEGCRGMSAGVAHYFVAALVGEGKLKRTKRGRWRNIAPPDAKD